MAPDKQHAHELIERLAPSQVAAVVGMLEAMLDPVAHAIANAPVDDEQLSADGAKALDVAREWSRHNESIPHEEVLAELGLSPEEVDRFQEPK